LGIACRVRRDFRVESSGKFGERGVKPRAATEDVDRFEAARGDKATRGDSRERRLATTLDRCREGVVQRLLREIEIAEEANEMAKTRLDSERYTSSTVWRTSSRVPSSVLPIVRT